jgi:hypothetical protein
LTSMAGVAFLIACSDIQRTVRALLDQIGAS